MRKGKKMEDNLKGKHKKNKKHAVKNTWPYKVFVLAMALSLAFSILSTFLLGSAGIIVSIIIIVVFISISIVTDMIGVAVTACTKEPFMAMCSKKVRGAKEGLMLIRNADKVASLCADVIGDICGVLSGSAGASIVVQITLNVKSTSLCILISGIVTAFIAAVTIFGKALGKRVAMDKCNGLILKVGAFLSLFTKQNKSKHGKDKK